jgi:hypothetical protein
MATSSTRLSRSKISLCRCSVWYDMGVCIAVELCMCGSPGSSPKVGSSIASRSS